MWLSVGARELYERVRQMRDVNAVIGLQFTYHHIGRYRDHGPKQRKSVFALTVTGTACRIRAAGS